jgi:hypothetical protein
MFHGHNARQEHCTSILAEHPLQLHGKVRSFATPSSHLCTHHPPVTHSPAQGDILEDIELIENLEETKRTALDIEDKVKLAKVTEVSISKAREVYRPVATRGSLVYFLIDNLNALDRWGAVAVARGISGQRGAPVQWGQGVTCQQPHPSTPALTTSGVAP